MTDQNDDADEQSETIDERAVASDSRGVEVDDAEYRTSFDPEADSVTKESVKAVAALNDADPDELPVLADYLDPEALDALFGPRPNGETRPSEARIEFAFDGYEVSVYYSGTIAVRRHESVAGE